MPPRCTPQQVAAALCGRLLGMAPQDVQVREWHARPRPAPTTARVRSPPPAAATPAAAPAVAAAEPAAAVPIAAGPDVYPNLTTRVVEYVVHASAPTLPRTDFKFTRTQPPPATGAPGLGLGLGLG